MKCTYCGNEMESGNLKTEGGPGLFYMPDDENYSILSTQKGIERFLSIINKYLNVMYL